MKPIFLILYAVVVTLLLSLGLPRIRSLTPQLRRAFAITAALGVVVLIALLFLTRSI